MYGIDRGRRVDRSRIVLYTLVHRSLNNSSNVRNVEKKNYNYFEITVSPRRQTADISSIQFLFDYFIIIFLTSTFYAKWNSSRSPS